MNNTLLPKGFYDELYPDALKRMQMVSQLLGQFIASGFELVDPPLVEFEETLLSGTGQALADETFRVMDPKSHKMMAIRADMTVQVARIAVNRLTSDPRPLKLAYAGQVLRVQGDVLYGHRQLWQVGVELVGEDSLEADTEVLALAIKALKSLGIERLCIDFTIPSLAPALLEELDIHSEDRQLVLQAMDKKDIATIERLVTEKQLERLMPLLHMDISMTELKKMKLPKEIAKVRDRLNQVIMTLERVAPDMQISIDPLESLKFSYHSGIGFSIFAAGAKAELARGGRYTITSERVTEPAVGVTFYMNELLRSL